MCYQDYLLLHYESEKYFEKTKFHGIYRDNGLIAFNDIWSFQSIQKWLEEFSFDTKGFWIKHESEKRNLIINANKIDKKTNALFELNIFEYDEKALIECCERT